MTDVLDATDNSPLSHCHAVPHLQLTIDPDGDVDAMLALTSSSRSICSPHIHPEIISPVSLSLSSTTSDWMMQDESTESDQESPYRYRITSTHTRSPSDSEMVIIHPEEDIETPRTRTRTRTPSLLPPSSFLFDPTHVNVGSTPYASPMSRGLKRPSVSVPHESTPLPSPLSSPLPAHKIKELRSHSPDAEKDTSPRDADIHAESQQEKDTQVHGSSQQETEISPSPSPTQSPQSQSQSQPEPQPQSQSQTMQAEQSQHQTQQTQTQTTQEEPSQTQEQTSQQPQKTQESQESQQTQESQESQTQESQESQTQESQETQAQTTQEEPSQSNTPVADTDTPTPPAELDTDSRPHVLHIDSSQYDITSTEIDSTAAANIDMTPTSSISDEIDNSSPSSSTHLSSSSSPSDSDSEDDTMIRVCDPPTPLDVCHSSLPSPDSPTSAMPPPEQTVTLVDKDELRTHEDVQRSLHMRKQKMSRNPKRHDYMHRAKHQLLVHNATWNNETFQNIMNGSNNESNTPTPRPRSKSISFFNQAKLRYYRHEEEPHRMYHRPTASTECSSLSMNDILSNKPKQGILKRTTYVGPIHLPPDEEETPRSQYSSSSSSSCSSSNNTSRSSSNNSSRRPSISKSQSFSRSSHSEPTTPSIPQIVWNEISSEVDAEELIRQEEAEMERLEQMESARRSHSRNNDTTPPSNRPLSVRPPLTLTISTSPITSPTSPMSSPFLISPPSSGGTVSPSGSYSSIFSSNPSLTLDSPSNIISSSHLDIISSSQLDIVYEELITSSQVVSNSDSDSEDEAEEQISS